MKTEKYVKNQIILAKVFISIGLCGIITAALAYTLGFLDSKIIGIATGLAFGFTPVGLGFLIIYKNALKDPQKLKKIEIENEERNIFINTKSGDGAFWILYGYIFLWALIKQFVKVDFNIFIIITLFFMPIVYFVLTFLNNKKY